MNQIALIIAFTLSCTCNVWDNIFSQTQATSPILLSSSLNIHFPISVKEIEGTGVVDYNQELNLLSLFVKKDFLFGELIAFRMELHLDEMIAHRFMLMQSCQRYKLEFINLEQFKEADIEKIKEKTFIGNILFKYIGRKTDPQTGKQNNIYKFDPELLGTYSDLSEDQIQFSAFAEVDSDGQIVGVYEDEQLKKRLKFRLASEVQKPNICPKEQLEVINREKLKEMVVAQVTDENIKTVKDLSGVDFPDLPSLEGYLKEGEKDFDISDFFNEIPKDIIEGLEEEFDDEIPEEIIENIPEDVIDNFPDIPNLPFPRN